MSVAIGNIFHKLINSAIMCNLKEKLPDIFPCAVWSGVGMPGGVIFLQAMRFCSFLATFKGHKVHHFSCSLRVDTSAPLVLQIKKHSFLKEF